MIKARDLSGIFILVVITTISFQFHWIGIIVLFLLFLLFLYIMFMFYIFMMDRKRLNIEYRVKILNDGLEVFSHNQGKINFYPYYDISAIRVLNTHPLSYAAIVLKNEGIIYLFATHSRPLIRDLQERNIALDIECEEGAEWRIKGMNITPKIVEEGIY